MCVMVKYRKLAQPGRALGLGPRGRRFESSISDSRKAIASYVGMPEHLLFGTKESPLSKPRVYDPKNVIITVGGRLAWPGAIWGLCRFCGAVNIPNDAVAVCFICYDQGCPQCMVLVDGHFEHMELE